MLRQNCYSLALHIMILFATQAVASCGAKTDPELTALLSVGLKRGYPGVAILTQSGDRKIRYAAAGYSDRESTDPCGLATLFRWRALTRHLRRWQSCALL